MHDPEDHRGQATSSHGMLGCGCLLLVIGLGVIMLSHPVLPARIAVGALVGIAILVKLIDAASDQNVARRAYYESIRPAGPIIGKAVDVVFWVAVVILVLNVFR